MRSLRSIAAGGQDRASDVGAEAFAAFSHLYPQKLYWFLSHGYRPHEWQAAFHCADINTRLRRFRHLVAGRRGGKTMSAAWETLFYCLHPEVFHQDAHSVSSSRPLWVWVLTKDHEVGRPARMAFQEALDAAGLYKDKDYRWNKTEKTVEFIESGTFLQFKSADDPQSLRGAGLDILWIDEAAFVTTRDAWDVVRPALSDKVGIVITTTTPHGKNWFYDEFFTGPILQDPHQFRVEYTSIDRPSFHEEEWTYAKKTMHPSLFKQEYMAAFDAMAGLTLSGEWLHYFTTNHKADAATDAVALPRGEDGRIKLRKFIGVDPSTGEAADEFAIACIGVAHDNSMAFLLDVWHGKIQFPEQVDKIREWHLKYRPDLMGVESNAYQRVLAQMANRLEGFPPVVPMMNRGQKNHRIVSMSPLFKIGKVRVHPKQMGFIDQWVSFDGTRKDNRDDILDAVELAISSAGIILPTDTYSAGETKSELDDVMKESHAQIKALSNSRPYDPELGTEG